MIFTNANKRKLSKIFSVSLASVMAAGSVASSAVIIASAQETGTYSASYTCGEGGSVTMLKNDEYVNNAVYKDGKGIHGALGGLGENDSIMFRAYAKDGYVIDKLYVDGKPKSGYTGYDTAACVFNGFLANHSMSVTFKKGSSGNTDDNVSTAPGASADETYSINTHAGEGGTITGGGSNLQANGHYVVKIVAKPGYYLKSVTVNGETEYKSENSTGAEYTFDGLDETKNITATFARKAVKSFNVEMHKNAGGTVSVNSNAGVITSNTETEKVYKNVPEGTEVTYRVDAADGYKIASATFNGKSLGAEGKTGLTYTVPVTSNANLIVRFVAQKDFNTTTKATISTSGNSGGTITPTTSVDKDTNFTVKAVAKSGYHIKSFKVDGKTASSGEASEQEVTFSRVQSNHTVSVVFEKDGSSSGASSSSSSSKKTYKITTKAGKGGTITKTATVKKGSKKTISFKANSGYRVATFKIDGKSKKVSKMDDSGSVTFSNIGGNHTVEVTFVNEKKYLKITYKKPSAPKISVKSSKKGQAVIKWAKVKNADKYEISYRKSGSKKWTTKKTNKTSYTVNKLSAKKKYSFRARAINVNRYSSYSATKNVTIHK